MKKVNLDLEYEKWKKENIEHLKERFLDTHNFDNYLEAFWRDYQEEHNLVDESNELESNELDFCDNCNKNINKIDLGDGSFGCPICKRNDCINKF